MQEIHEALPTEEPATKPAKKIWWRFWGGLALFLLIALPAWVYFNFLRDIPLRISSRTTYLTEPLDEQGQFDFATALNAHLLKGLPPEDNLFPLMLQVLGVNATEWVEQLELLEQQAPWLDISSLPQNRRWISLTEHANEVASKEAIVHMATHKVEFDVYAEWQKKEEQIRQACQAPFRDEDFPWIAEHLRKQEAILRECFAFRERRGCEIPFVLDRETYTESFSSALGYQNHLVVDLTAYAMWKLHQGETEIALDALHTAWHLCDQLITLPRIEIYWTITSYRNEYVYPALGYIAMHPAVTAEQKASLRRLIASSQSPDYDALQLTSRIGTLEMLPLFAETEAMDIFSLWNWAETLDLIDFPGLKFDQNAALSTLNDYLDRLEQLRHFQDPHERTLQREAAYYQFAIEEEQPSPTQLVKQVLGGQQARGHFIARRMIAKWIGMQEFMDFAEDQRNLETRRTLLLLLLAVGEYRDREGHSPAKLDDLIPEYFDEIPLDPYANAPFRYEVDNQTLQIHSVGLNGSDDGGLLQPKAGDDIAFGNKSP